jgi:hypothetical protein
MTPLQRQRLYLGKVQLTAVTGGRPGQDGCDKHYQVSVKRGDGLPLTEMELRSVLSNLSWAIEGEDTLIDLERL